MPKHALVEQPSRLPTSKVLAGWVTGGGATLVLGLLAAVSDAVPADTFWGGLAAYVVTGAATYIKKARAVETGA